MCMKRYFVILCVLISGILHAAEAETGKLSGRFVINSNGDKVCFSQGNLRCDKSSGAKVWSFAPHQYDIIGAANVSGTDLANVLDLFGWSGNSTTNFGVSKQTGTSDYAGTSFRDWGNNPIQNGGQTAQEWRTLTKNEWNYFYTNHQKKAITVNGVKGLAFIPVNTTMTIADLADSYTAEAWTAIEARGILFLPATGYRSGTTYTADASNGYYWTADKSGTNNAVSVQINCDSPGITSPTSSRSRGCAVRLVKEVEDCQVKITINKNIEDAGTISITVL